MPKGKPNDPAHPVGRPRIQPTQEMREQVLLCSKMGLTQEQMGKLLRISGPSLRKVYRAELDVGSIDATMAVARNMFHMATDPDHKDSAKAAMFWLQQRAPEEWQKVKRVEHTGKDGGAIETRIEVKQTVDSRLLTPDQRQALREILVAAAAQQASQPAVIEHQPDTEDEEDGDENEVDDGIDDDMAEEK